MSDAPFIDPEAANMSTVSARQDAWMLDPSNLQNGLDLVAGLAKAGRIALLQETVRQIRKSHAANVEALEALCLALYKIDRFADMLNVAREGLDIDPQRAVLHFYAAHALSVCGHNVEALIHSRAAGRLSPDDAVMQYQLGCLELSNGEFETGWTRHNLFYTLPVQLNSLVFPDFPVWNGERVTGRTFLLVGEQGRGDEIQFIRFAQWLHQQGAIVDVFVSQPIARIAASMTGVRSVLTVLPTGPYDYWSHMLRMPEHMRLDLSMLPIAMPYLAAETEILDCWQARIDNMLRVSAHPKNRRIGVVWAGGPYHPHERFRSIRLDALKVLFSLPDTTWFSLQKGDSERDSEALADELDLHTLGPAIEDFADTLAILETLDLLITVDTSVAHLAGAANLPVWVLLPAYTQWRWLSDRTDSPWYPSMRLFRQRDLGHWGPVIEDVREALQAWCTCNG
jgi:tetratricopeptide (TPR) repeat protein